MTPPRHVQHCNVNCSDLPRSLDWYGQRLGLLPLVRTNPAPQDGAGFGLSGTAQWDAWMMSDGRANPVVDLLEWQQPRPSGAPVVDGLGLAALRFDDPSVAAPTSTTDPDGVRIELEPGTAPRFVGVVLHVTDPTASIQWYRRTLGLTGAGAELNVPGDDFTLSLRPAPDPSAGPPAAAHQVGLYRIAFLVDDARAAVAALRALDVACPDPVWLDMGPTIPIDGLWAAFFTDPDGICLEFIEAPTGA